MFLIKGLFLLYFFLKTNIAELIPQEDHYKKINGISEIVWINMDRSVERRTHMEKELSHISVPNRRFPAIDGIKNNLQRYLKIYNKNPVNNEIHRKLSNAEIACTLSHLLAIESLKNIKGDYFLILEDDIIFENMKMIPFTLEEIIRDAPPFDILQVAKTLTSNYRFSYLYEVWKANNPTFWGAFAYVISRKGIENIIHNTKKRNIYRDPSDYYLYIHSNVYTYKYNIVSYLEIDSTIHLSHHNIHKNSNSFQLQVIKEDFHL